MPSERTGFSLGADLTDMISRIVEESVSAAVGSAETATRHAVDASARPRGRGRSESSRTAPCPPGRTVRVRNRAGGITVRGESVDTVTVIARAESRTDVDDLLSVTADDDGVVIDVGEGSGWRGLRGVDLDIVIPAGSPLDASTGAGKVDARGVGPDVRLACGAGKVRVRDAQGPVALKTGAGNVEASGVTGAITVDCGAGTVAVEGALSGASSIRAALGRVDVRIPATSNLKVAARATKAANDFGLPVLNGNMAGVIGTGDGGTLKLQARGVLELRRT